MSGVVDPVSTRKDDDLTRLVLECQQIWRDALPEDSRSCRSSSLHIRTQCAHSEKDASPVVHSATDSEGTKGRHDRGETEALMRNGGLVIFILVIFLSEYSAVSVGPQFNVRAHSPSLLYLSLSIFLSILLSIYLSFFLSSISLTHVRG